MSQLTNIIEFIETSVTCMYASFFQGRASPPAFVSLREQLAASSSAGQSHPGMNVIKTDDKEYSAVKDSHLDDVMFYL